MRKLEAASVAYMTAGDPAVETAHNQQGEDSSIVRADGRPGLRGGKWFSFDLPVDPASPMALVVTYNSDNRRPRSFEIVVDGQHVGAESVAQSSVSRFYDVEYPLPETAVRGKQKVTVRFEASSGNDIATVFAIRTVRKGSGIRD